MGDNEPGWAKPKWIEPEQVKLKTMGEVTEAHDFIVHVKEYGGPYNKLEEIGCTVEEIGNLEVRITYPSGTTRVFLWPATACESYRVMLPSGIELRDKVCRGTNYLRRVEKKED